MGFDPIRSILTLVIVLILVSVPASAVKFLAAAGSSSETASAFGEYKLKDSASLDSDVTLGEGVVSRLSSASGTGENKISEGVSGGGKSVTKTIASEGSFSSTSSDFGCEAGAVSDYETSLAGSRGSISTVSIGKMNQMIVAGVFDQEGDMDVSFTSLAADEALTTGSASILGTPCFDDELVRGIRGEETEVSVHGLYVAGEELGEFGMVAQNAKPGVDVANAWTWPWSTPTTAATYKLTGYKWPISSSGPNIPIVLSADVLPGNNPLDSVKTEISAAQAEWDGYSSKTLFSPLSTITGDTYNKDVSKYGTRDNKNVHLGTATGLSDNTIAMTVTWYNKYTKTALESDCWYNNKLSWRIDGPLQVGSGSGTKTFDIRSIALHELGHTLGLADLYESSNKGQTMYGYNDGTSDWTLNTGDITGIQKIYGK
jgi:hypothetical protein